MNENVDAYSYSVQQFDVYVVWELTLKSSFESLEVLGKFKVLLTKNLNQ